MAHGGTWFWFRRIVLRFAGICRALPGLDGAQMAHETLNDPDLLEFLSVF